MRDIVITIAVDGDTQYAIHCNQYDIEVYTDDNRGNGDHVGTFDTIETAVAHVGRVLYQQPSFGARETRPDVKRDIAAKLEELHQLVHQLGAY